MTLARRLRNTWRELFGVSLKPALPERKQERDGWDFLEDMGEWGERPPLLNRERAE